MNKQILFFILITTAISVFPQNKNNLSERYDEQQLKQILMPRSQWKPFPGIDDRVAWEAVPDSIRINTIKKAEGYLNYKWPSIEATTALLFLRTGNRSIFEKIYFQKRNVLSTLVMAELFEDKGRFIDQIVNGIWNICEESSWMLPAHYKLAKYESGLPDVTEPFVDLFSAATGDLLAWTDYFLGNKLDKISPQIQKRIYSETEKRILTPILTKPHFWMKVSMNWNTWICSNWLATALLLEKNENKRVKEVKKILWSLDNFLNPYPRDGGCDEGPGYWTAAGESLFESIELLNKATDNKFEVDKIPLLRNIASFIYKAQMTKDYFINFADAHPKMHLEGGMIYLIGKRINDRKMTEFGAYYYNPNRLNIDPSHFTRTFFDLFDLQGIKNIPRKLPLLRDVWLADIKVMTARDVGGSDKGFCIAANAGNNGESHNHNDIGSYMVYYNNQPVLVDVGSGTYTARTFNDQRYSLWFISSAYHNVPTVNGILQGAGLQYKADDVIYKSNKKDVTFKFDMGKAYPVKAGIINLSREIKFNRGSEVIINDKFKLKDVGEIIENLMTAYRPDLSQKGIIKLKVNEDNIFVKYDPNILKATYEKRILNQPEDVGIIKTWGNNIYRIQLSNIRKIKSGDYRMVISNTP